MSAVILTRWIPSGTAVLLALAVGLPHPPVHPRRAAPPVSFARDVAPILQQKCQVCHRPGSIAPMPLISYDSVVAYTALIRKRLLDRTMPPWHIDKTVGIQEFKNDRSLSDAQINTIVRWIDAGAPLGNPRELPPPIKWPDPNVWQLGERFGPPDLVIKSKPYTVQATGQDKWWRPTVDAGVTEPRWVRAIEIKPSVPGGRRAVHHVLTLLDQHEEGVTGLASSAAHAGGAGSGDMPMTAGLFMEWAVGKTGEMYPPNAGKLMLPGARIRWEVHYYAVGEEILDDVVELGVWFYPRNVVPKTCVPVIPSGKLNTYIWKISMPYVGSIDVVVSMKLGFTSTPSTVTRT